MPFKDATKRKEYNKKYWQETRNHQCDRKRKLWRKYRETVLQHYSNGEMCCSCCGETQYEFLALDHIANDGAAFRKKTKSNYSYSYLIQAGFPAGIQVLCHNCNMAKGFYGGCPHNNNAGGLKLTKDTYVAKGVVERVEVPSEGETNAVEPTKELVL